MLLFSCSKAEKTIIPDEDNLLKVTIIAGNPQVDPGTKTEIQGTTPYWSVGDAIGVSDGTTSNNQFTTSIESASSTATFTGHTVSGTLYAYYPYTSNGVGTAGENTGAKVDIPANQNPTATSFDGSADVMVAKAFTVDPENTTVSGLQFKRLGAVVKIVLKDNTTGHVLADQHPSVISIETSEESDVLAGRQIVDMVNQNLGEIYYNGSNKVTANYTSSTHFLINSTNAAYIVVHPRNLTAGTTLTVYASTEGYTIEKVITVPAGGINLEAGKITTLNIGLSDAQVTASSSGLALPFVDDFSWQTATSNAITTVPDNLYSAFSTIYADKGANKVRMSTGSVVGNLTTVELDLSSAFYVIVNAEIYNTNQTKIKVSVDDDEVQTASEYLSEAKDYIFNFSAATAKSKVKIFTEGKQAVLNKIEIRSGTYVFPPVINVTSDNPMSATNENDIYAIEYSITNPVEGSQVSATSNVSWIHDFDYTTSGEVGFEVDAQAEGAAARTGVITLSYPGAENVDVTVNQAAAAGGTSEYTTKWVATSGGLGTKVGTGTIKTTVSGGSNTQEWNYTRTLISGESYSGWTSSCIQLGKNGGIENLTLETENIPGKIKSVSVECSSYNSAHKCSITVGGTSYLSSTATAKWTTVSALTGTGTSSGKIVISFTDGSRALYIKSITVVYEN